MKIQVRGLISHQAVSELHFIPKKQSGNAQYYVTEILAKTLKSAMSCKSRDGSTLQEKLLRVTSKAIFQQDMQPVIQLRNPKLGSKRT